ncbi:hypothetical protein, partial [Geodermatophilus sp. CPCC 206100]|uniref:hypothetical protein n=1 Tax=Geodermatophilus sp. CPCC 206100 TaxID=3020054 RepID=UPI003AFFE3A9
MPPGRRRDALAGRGPLSLLLLAVLLGVTGVVIATGPAGSDPQPAGTAGSIAADPPAEPDARIGTAARRAPSAGQASSVTAEQAASDPTARAGAAAGPAHPRARGPG